MFCSTFYCPYVKYMLKDMEALCSLSSADKKIIILMSDIIKRKYFLLKHCLDRYELQTSGKPGKAL